MKLRPLSKLEKKNVITQKQLENNVTVIFLIVDLEQSGKQTPDPWSMGHS